MKCPYCGKDMEDGFIQGARGVLFSPDEKVLFVLKNPFSKKDVKITGFYLETSSPASYCYDCECLIRKKGTRRRRERLTDREGRRFFPFGPIFL